MNLPIPEDVCIPHPGFRWGPSGDAELGTFPSLQGHSSSNLRSFAVVTGANSKGEDPEAGFWKLVPPHFPGSALWPGSGVSSGNRAVSMVDALQIRGHPAWSRRELCGCRDCSYLHTQVATETSEVISYALSSLARLAVSPPDAVAVPPSSALGGQQGRSNQEAPSCLLLGHNSRKFLPYQHGLM